MKKHRCLHLLIASILAFNVTACSAGQQNDATKNATTPLPSSYAIDRVEASPEESPADTPTTTTLETDVIVVGGGGTGLVAALAAAENGKKVILLEKMGYLGGATSLSAGKVPAAGTRQQQELNIQDSPEALAKDILRPGDYAQRADLVNLVAQNAKDFIEWAEGYGVQWTLETTLLYNGQSQYRMHVAEGGGTGIIQPLSEAIEKNENITVMLETPGTDLITDDSGAVTGVNATSKSEGALTIHAPSVVLATSGFGANREMVEKYIPSMLNAYPMVAPGATGEGILWGQALGAGVRNMTAYQGYAPISMDTKKSLGQNMLNKGGILINTNSERFMNEVTGYSNLASSIVNQPDAYAYMIWDQTIADTEPDSMTSWEESDILITADSLETLATALNLDLEKLQSAIGAYEESLSTGSDVFGRTSLPESFQAPYYAVKVTGDFRHTQGGLTIDLETHVLYEDGTQIPGLYAGGGVTEGFSSTGGPSYMSGNGLLQALVLGKIAGEQAAK